MSKYSFFLRFGRTMQSMGELRHIHHGVTAMHDVEIVRNQGYDYFRPQHMAENKPLVALLPGWLGDHTFDYVATHVASHGFRVVVPSHESYGMRYFGKNHIRRSQAVHNMLAAVTAENESHEVVLVGHSNGTKDALHITEYSARHRLYRIRAVGSVAGVGLNGRRISPLEMIAEVQSHLGLLQSRTQAEAAIVLTSLRNFMRNPIAAAEEAVIASTIDCRPRFNQLLDTHVLPRLLEVYMQDDKLIPPPRGTGEILPGTHITPVLKPDALLYTVHTLID